MKHLISFTILGAFSTSSILADELDLAFTDLKDGRAYRDELNQKIRRNIVEDFIDGGTGTPVERHPVKLRKAIDRSIEIRKESGLGSVTSDQAWYIANESLEALLFGYLSAGNYNLLNGTRLTFPNSGDIGLGITETRQPPFGADPNISPSLQSLSYAQLYFQEGIKETLSFIQSDPEGKIRSTDLVSIDAFPYFTQWNNPDYLPHPRFEDQAFNDSEDQASLTAASLLGKTIRRYGVTAIGVSDKLWRSAYNDPQQASRQGEILTQASENLRCHMHAQFMASLPIAAELSDGQTGELDGGGNPVVTNNTYQDVGANVVRANVTAAAALQQRIARGDRPKQIDLVPQWDIPTVNNQISKIQGLRNNAQQSWSDARTAIQLRDSAIVAANSDRLVRRERYKFRLWQITGIHPDSQGRFAGLDTEEGRQEYLKFIENFVLARTQDPDLNDPWYTQVLNGFPVPSGETAPTEISDLGFAALRMLQAFNELEVAKSRIASVPQKIAIENRRNNTENELIVRQGVQIQALNAALALAKQFKIITCVCGLNSGVSIENDTSAIVEAAQSAIRNLINTRTATGINDANSRATIENLLIEQGLLVEQLPSSVIQAQLSVNELRRLFAEAQQLVADYQFHAASTDDLWYNDPELVFEKEATEARYEDVLRAYQNEAYLLSLMLERAWVEFYENPVKNANSAPVPFSNNSAYDQFPDAESVFAVGDFRHVSDFTHALRDWSNYLAVNRGPRRESTATPMVISYRRDILTYPDFELVGPEGDERFQLNETSWKESIRRLRANILTSNEEIDTQSSGEYELRIEFPMNLHTQLKIPGLGERKIYLFNQVDPGDPDIWNRRITGVGVRTYGRNLALIGPTFNADLALHGTITRESYFLGNGNQDEDSNIRQSTNLTLFQDDPLYRSPVRDRPRYETPLSVQLAGSDTPPPIAPVSWPFWCDKWVFSVRGGTNIFNWQNIEDIEFWIYTEYGPPVTIANNYNWGPLN